MMNDEDVDLRSSNTKK